MCDDNVKEMRMKFIKDLLEKRTIYLKGEIDGTMAAETGAAIIWLNARDETKEIIIYIDSGGGNVSAGLDIYDVVKHSKASTRGIVYRRANSMASIILQACTKRQAMKHSEIAIHNVTIKPYKTHDFKKDCLTKTLAEISKVHEHNNNILAERTGRTIEEIEKKCIEDISMTAEEAKNFGLVDEII